jgi:hypothetical protein
MRLASAGAADWPGGIRNGRPLISHDLVTGLHARISRPLRQAPERLGLATEFFFLRHERTNENRRVWFTGCAQGEFWACCRGRQKLDAIARAYRETSAVRHGKIIDSPSHLVVLAWVRPRAVGATTYAAALIPESQARELPALRERFAFSLGSARILAD